MHTLLPVPTAPREPTERELVDLPLVQVEDGGPHAFAKVEIVQVLGIAAGAAALDQILFGSRGPLGRRER